MTRSEAGAAAAALLAAACGTAPLGPGPASVRVTVANPARLDLRLMTGSGAGASEVSAPGRAASWTAALQAGKYWLSDPALGPLCALPLLPGALGAAELSVVVEPPQPSSDAWACIPAGPTLLGDEIGVGQEDERPARVALVPTFWIARREVTNAEFARFLAECAAPIEGSWLAFDSKKCRVARDGPSGRFTTDAPDLPVVTVSLAGALAYCAWLTRATGVVHRLPTEVEWEKAARGPGSCVYAFGNVYERGKANAESGALAPVARYAANGWGLYDMTGNAFEWVSDRYAGGPDQVLRGGSYVLDGMYLRNSFRMRQRPSTRADDFGFRPVREAPPGSEGKR